MPLDGGRWVCNQPFLDGRVLDVGVLARELGFFGGNLVSDLHALGFGHERRRAAELEAVAAVHQEPEEHGTDQEDRHEQEAVLPAAVPVVACSRERSFIKVLGVIQKLSRTEVAHILSLEVVAAAD